MPYTTLEIKNVEKKIDLETARETFLNIQKLSIAGQYLHAFPHHLERIKDDIRDRERVIQEIYKSEKTVKLSYLRRGINVNIEKDYSEYLNSRKDTLLELRTQIQEKRKEIRTTEQTINLNHPKGDYVQIKADMDGLHLEHGDFIKLLFIKFKKYFTQSKIPTDRDFHIGIELEFVSKLTKEQIINALYTKNPQLGKYINIKSDASVESESGYDYTHEANIIAKIGTFERIVKDFVSVVGKDSIVNKSCGFHVHLDMRGYNEAQRKTIFNNFVTFQPLLFNLNPKSRASSRYCLKVSKTDTDYKHYDAISRYALSEHNSLEIRIHAGTLNPAKVINWVKLLLAICQYPTEIVELNYVKTIESANRILRLPEEMVSFYEQRLTELKGE